MSGNKFQSFQRKQSSGHLKASRSFDEATSAQVEPSEYKCPLTEKELFTNINTGINFNAYQDIPVSCKGDNVPEPIKQFDEAALHQKVIENIKKAEYKDPTPVQQYAIPIGLEGRDIMACAQTGSGKTAAFLLPIITMMLNEGVGNAKRKAIPAEPVFLVLAPTRELALQIYVEAVKFSFKTLIKCVSVYGGSYIGDQIRQLREGAHIVIATPGRLIDLMEKKRITLSKIKYLCFDEADRMLDMGFEPQIRTIVQKLDMPTTRQTIMFSATFPKNIRQLAEEFLTNYIFLSVGRVGSTIESIKQIIKEVDDKKKKEQLQSDLRDITGKTIIFVQKKRSAAYLSRELERLNFPARAIHGDLDQYQREKTLKMFRNGRVQILVATDVASRGLDIAEVAHVINYDLPLQIDDYVHRIGRTGRAGNIGTATSYYNESSGSSLARPLLKILRECNQPIPEFLRNLPEKGGKSKRGRNVYRNRSGPYNRPPSQNPHKKRR